ncbi:MAG TPA: phenylalanine--tRNA ligase beta subunit-related protein [Polyangia bacterium]|jgi:DNA/RNA-binding domain of Phe-tRNA-synthetase-like protein
MRFPPTVTHELSGWTLLWAELAPGAGDPDALAALRRDAAAAARAAYAVEQLAAHPTVAAVRKLFRAAGCDPTRYRPASEALLRRVLKGEELPPIGPQVDLNNCLSLELCVPACVMDTRALQPPFTLRAGRPGESMTSMRGPFDLAGKPTLVDAAGPFGTPITDDERVKVTAATASVWLVAYLPAGVVAADAAAAALRRLAARGGLAIAATAATPG